MVTNARTTAVGATTATLAFTANAAATSYTVTYTPAGGTTTTVTPAPTASPVLLTGLTASTTAATVNFITTATPPPPPANDDCAAAVLVPVTLDCATPTAGTILGATQSLAPTTNCGVPTQRAADVWYRFVATGTSHYVTVMTQFPATIDVRSGSFTTSTSVRWASKCAARS